MVRSGIIRVNAVACQGEFQFGGMYATGAAAAAVVVAAGESAIGVVAAIKIGIINGVKVMMPRKNSHPWFAEHSEAGEKTQAELVMAGSHF